MKKNYLILAAIIASIGLASCSNEEYVGEFEGGTTGERAISFNSSYGKVTRDEKTGDAAASLLNKNFVVLGYKGGNQIVFDNYQANFVDASGSSAGSTESNSAGWEYVSYKNLPFGTKMATGDELNDRGVAANATGSSTNIIQSIKYWDYNASTYDFFAYSLGAGEADTDGDADSDNQYAKATALALTGYGDSDTHPGYQLTGSQSQLGMCYISKQKHIVPSSSSPTEVDLEFVNFLSKIQLKFFETIPGYSVKDLRFYTDDNTKSDSNPDVEGNDGLVPALYGAANSIPKGGTYEITFDASYDPVITLESTTGYTPDSKVEFPTTLSSYASYDYKETDVENTYIGRTASTATATSPLSVLPNSTGATLTLKMDYTLVSRDGTGETIDVSGATATIPANYTKWMSNYAYTYIFKITDDKLVPITLDAIVKETEDGNQTTITTVADPSITTYQSGAVTNEYSAGNIYVAVEDGGTTVLTVGTNANLYTATVEVGAAQGLDGAGNVAITEEQVANVLTKTLTDGKYTVTDANGKKMTVTPVATTEETADRLIGGQTSIPAADAPGSKELAINCATFNAVNNTVYVFEYLHYYTAVEAATYNAALTGAVSTSDTNPSTSTNYTAAEAATYNAALTGAVSTSNVKSKHYKVIKVGTPTAVVGS